MKGLILTILILVLTLLVWFSVGMKIPDKEVYLSSRVLDISKAINVTIDTDFIKGLNPANGK